MVLSENFSDMNSWSVSIATVPRVSPALAVTGPERSARPGAGDEGVSVERADLKDAAAAGVSGSWSSPQVQSSFGLAPWPARKASGVASRWSPALPAVSGRSWWRPSAAESVRLSIVRSTGSTAT